MTRGSLSNHLFKLARLTNKGRHVRQGPISFVKHWIRQRVIRFVLKLLKL